MSLKLFGEAAAAFAEAFETGRALSACYVIFCLKTGSMQHGGDGKVECKVKVWSSGGVMERVQMRAIDLTLTEITATLG